MIVAIGTCIRHTTSNPSIPYPPAPLEPSNSYTGCTAIEIPSYCSPTAITLILT